MDEQRSASPEISAGEDVTPDSEHVAAEDEEVFEDAPLGVVPRVLRTLMLLAASSVVVVALPLAAWQMTTLEQVQTRVEGTDYVLKVQKRFGEHAVLITDSADRTTRIPLNVVDGERLDGPVSIETDNDGRVVRISIGETERSLRHDGEAYRLVGPE